MSDVDNYEEEKKEEEDVVISTSLATTASGRGAGEGISCSMHIQCIVTYVLHVAFIIS